ncbi:DNA translocase FtsK 4TM domain-containing protein, partial [Clostridium baratii]|uniref:DNA translocase FtsK 4TM domain-containing protein n=1 Tax=Clostridium baratii TaxID=1561 RepID=UPI00374FB225
MKSILNGGVLGYVIAYPLYKFLGIIGSYIIYIALIGIATIITFDITLHDIGICVKKNSKKIKKPKIIFFNNRSPQLKLKTQKKIPPALP